MLKRNGTIAVRYAAVPALEGFILTAKTEAKTIQPFLLPEHNELALKQNKQRKQPQKAKCFSCTYSHKVHLITLKQSHSLGLVFRYSSPFRQKCRQSNLAY